MFKFNNRNTRTRCEICSNLTIKISEQRRWHLTYFTPCSIVSIVNFEQVNVGWEVLGYFVLIKDLVKLLVFILYKLFLKA